MHKQRGGIELLVLALVVLASFIIAGGTSSFENSIPQNNGQPVSVSDVQQHSGQKTLQLITLPSKTSSPTVNPTVSPPTVTPPAVAPPPSNPPPESSAPPSPTTGYSCTIGPEDKSLPPCGDLHSPNDGACTCGNFGNKAYDVNCTGPKIRCASPTSPVICFERPDDPSCTLANHPGCKEYCFGKPVIYLYPEITTNVNVKLTIPGAITISSPHYSNSGWQNIEAHPDGSLIYQGKNYNELYYETAVNKHVIPDNGILLDRINFQDEANTILLKLGLKQNERREFFDYWMPKLNETRSKYILFSVYSKEEKNQVDYVDISPKPDTFIELLFYFKPVDYPYSLKKFDIPAKPPERVGFTAVEWGGTIDD